LPLRTLFSASSKLNDMKIAVVTATFPPYQSGMGNSAYEIARFLASQNEVMVFTPEYENAEAENFASLPYEIKYLKPFLQFGLGAFIPSLYQELKDFDVIYLHYPFYGTAEIIWLYKILHPRKNLVIHFHMDTPNLAWHTKILSWPLKLVKNNLMKRADKIISASLDYVAHSSINDVWKKYPTKFVEVPFGVHLDKFHVLPYDIVELQELRYKLGIKKGERVVLFVGALDEAHSFKGVDNLIKAIVKLLNVKLLIIGDGDRRQKYENLTKELKIEKNVIFTGRVSDEYLVKYYNLADIFVLPSVDKSEAFGIVLIEAMACGVPVMASDLPGVRSVFANGVQGITVAPDSARHLQKKLEEYLRYPQKRLKMGRAARELVERKYDWRKIGYKLNQVIK